MRFGRSDDRVLLQSKWNYEDHDDSDAIADVLRRRAVKQRALTAKGLIDSLAHPASYDDEDIGVIVIDPAFVDLCRDGRPHEALRKTVEPKLLVWLKGGDVGKRQRARYALVRWHGPSSELAASGLAGKWHEVEAVLEALDGVSALPASLAAAFAALLQKEAWASYVESEPSERCYGRLAKLLALFEPPERDELVRQSLTIEELCHRVVHAVQSSDPALGGSASILGPARARFLAAVATIETSRGAGLPNRAAVADATTFAPTVVADAEAIRATLTIFDLVPGAPALAHTVTPFAELLARGVDLLTPAEIAKLAGFIVVGPVERLPAAAAAWVRLPAAEAEALSRKFGAGDKATAERRQLAIASAYWRYAGRSEAIQKLIAPAALMATADQAPPELRGAMAAQAIRSARNLAEFERAVTLAGQAGARGVTRSLLAQLRETPMRISADLEPWIGELLDADDQDWIEQDIDGENPFTDRRAALKRCLAVAKKRWAKGE